jgi:hypothetical protein
MPQEEHLMGLLYSLYQIRGERSGRKGGVVL